MRSFSNYIQESVNTKTYDINVPKGMSLFEYIKRLWETSGEGTREERRFVEGLYSSYEYGGVGSWIDIGAFKTLLELKPKYRELQPDYPYIYRGLRTRRISELLRLRWKPLDKDFLITKQTYKSKYGISSWSWDSNVAWGFTHTDELFNGEAPSGRNSDRLIGVKDYEVTNYIEDNLSDIEGGSGYMALVARVKTPPFALFNRLMSARMSKLFKHGGEMESVLVDEQRPITVDWIVPRKFWEGVMEVRGDF